MNEKELSDRDICTKFITPALRHAGWDEQGRVRKCQMIRDVEDHFHL